MAISKELFFFFCALGVFNGLLISCYLFINGKKNVSVYFLGLLVLTLSLRIGKSVWLYFMPSLPKLYLQIGLSACFLIGPSLYYFIKAEQQAPKLIPRKWVSIIAAFTVLVVLAGLIYPYANHPRIWNVYYFKIIYAQWGIFILLSGYALRNTFKRTLAKQEKPTYREIWLLMVWGSVTIIYSIYVATMLTGSPQIYITGSLAFSLLLYAIIVFVLYGKLAPLGLSDVGKSGHKKISPEDAALIQNRLNKLIIERQVFKNPELKLVDMAREINVPPHQLSQFLNESLGKTYTWYINELRINEACKMLTARSHLSIEAIGFEVGFNSRSTFFSAFKKVKGTTPALFQRLHASNAA